MQSQDESRLRSRILEEFEKEVVAANDMFCYRAWRGASRYMRRKYPRFALSEDEYHEKLTAYREAVESGAFSVDWLVSSILQPLVSIEDICKSRMSVKTVSGRILKAASYAGCLLGHEASFGDVETHLRILDWEAGLESEGSFANSFQNGRIRSVISLLNDQLQLATLDLIEKGWSKSTNSTFYGPSIWRFNDQNRPIIDAETLNTQYHLYLSLSHCVERIASGRADGTT